MDDLTDLNPCPLCGASAGYEVEYSGPQWSESCPVVCASCYAEIACTRRHDPPGHARAQWQEATKHYAALRAQIAALTHQNLTLCDAMGYSEAYAEGRRDLESPEEYATRLVAQVAALEAERDAERARADMHADLCRRTAEALGIKGDRSHMPEVAATLRAERDAARAEAEALRRDAQRYRWLRSDDIEAPADAVEIYVIQTHRPFTEDSDEVLIESALDAAIDAAQAQQKGGGDAA